MNASLFAPFSVVMVMISLGCSAEESTECFSAEVEAHVVEQFRIYGPKSKNREYFGFVYRVDGIIASAVTRGIVCRWNEPCEVENRSAAVKIPQGAKVLGEWHTHPHSNGSSVLSGADVRGANANRHIRCYRAYFSTPEGDVFSWDPTTRIATVAMESLTRLGNYRESRGAWATQ